jgi:hypothetical protein
MRLVLVGAFVVSTAGCSAGRGLDRYRLVSCPADTPDGKPMARLASAADSVLVRDGRGELIVILEGTNADGSVQSPLFSAHVILRGAHGASVDTTVLMGIAKLRVRPGTYTIHVNRSAYREWISQVEVRAGRHDTLELKIGHHVTCLFRMSGS